MRPSSAILLVLWLSLCGATVPALAAPAHASMAQTMSMDQAVKMVEQRFRARVVKAESQRDGVHTVYVLRLLNDSGRVWTVRVDADNGSIS